MNVIVTGEKGLGMTYSNSIIGDKGWLSKITNTLLNDIVPDNSNYYLKHTCLCGKYRDENDRDKDYELPNHRRYCNVCKERLEWRTKEI